MKRIAARSETQFFDDQSFPSQISLALRSDSLIFLSLRSPMLFLKRFATSLVLFIILFVFLEMAAIIGVGVIVGSRVGENAADFRSAYAAGEAADSEASGGYGRLTLLGAMGTAAVCSLATEFPGLLQGRTERGRAARST